MPGKGPRKKDVQKYLEESEDEDSSDDDEAQWYILEKMIAMVNG